MWPLAELDHGLVEVIFSANGSRTSSLSARVRRQAHYSSILPLQASGIICHNWVWHDHTTECIKILLAAQASSLAPACLQAAAVMDTSRSWLLLQGYSMSMAQTGSALPRARAQLLALSKQRRAGAGEGRLAQMPLQGPLARHITDLRHCSAIRA